MRALKGVLGTWELGVVAFMVVLYLGGIYINPKFFGDASALISTLRDASRFGVMAVGMSFVIINRDFDLSVGSTMGLSAGVFSILYAPDFYGTSAWFAAGVSMVLGGTIGLINGLLVTYLRIPAFIATLTMLFIGRGLLLGITSGRAIGYADHATESLFFELGTNNALGFNNQILLLLVVALVGGVVLAKTRYGYETYATGGSLQAAELVGIKTHTVRIRAFVISALCATLAGLMKVAQDKGSDSLLGQGAELVVIASVIVGGASILGGRGKIVGSCLGAILIVLIDKVLREGVPTTRTILIDGEEIVVRAFAQLPSGAVPAFLGVILIAAVLLEPMIIRRKVIQRLIARLRKRPPPPVAVETVALEAPATRGGAEETGQAQARGLTRLLYYRETPAVLFVLALWLVGFALRPDFWANLDNSFNLLLAFSEIALMAVGMAYVIGNGDIDLSVGSVLALSGATAAFFMRNLGVEPVFAALAGFAAGTAAGVVTGLLVTKGKLPAFVATLGMVYIARGVAAWIVAGRQLSQFPESYNLLGRKFSEVLRYWDLVLPSDSLLWKVATAVSNQTLILFALAIVAGLILWRMPFGYKVKATGGNQRAARFSGINVDRVRFTSLVFCSMCAALAGLIYIAFFRSFNPSAGQLRELEAIAAVIIGGGSIFGGHGSVLGALAGAAVIMLIRSVLSLQIITADGESFVMPQHWVNLSIGVVLIVAVVSDIWLRQQAIIGTILRRIRPILGARRSLP